MRKHRSSSSQAIGLLEQKVRQLLDARIDAAVVEYTEILQDFDHIDFVEIERRIAQAKQGGFPPEPRWKKRLREERTKNGNVGTILE